jgi:hypothetical protein
MPIIEYNSKSTDIPYWKYGRSGYKYYFQRGNDKSRLEAYHRALLQNNAIHARKSLHFRSHMT